MKNYIFPCFIYLYILLPYLDPPLGEKCIPIKYKLDGRGDVYTCSTFSQFALHLFFSSQIIGLGIKKGLTCQVANYDFRTSMFDVVALSFVRMALLLIAYAAFHSRHWAMVAVS